MECLIYNLSHFYSCLVKCEATGGHNGPYSIFGLNYVCYPNQQTNGGAR